MAGAAAAGELTATTLGDSLGWKPSRCAHPAKLYFHITDVDTYNAAVEEYNDHLLVVRSYRECVGKEAQEDAHKAAQAIASGVDRAYDRIRAELESARSELESAKKAVE